MHQNVKTGSPVFTSDGEELGTVKEVRGGFFKVDAPMTPDYWLACDCVAGEAVGEVRLSFPKNTLDENKMGEPATV